MPSWQSELVHGFFTLLEFADKVFCFHGSESIHVQKLFIAAHSSYKECCKGDILQILTYSAFGEILRKNKNLQFKPHSRLAELTGNKHTEQREQKRFHQANTSCDDRIGPMKICGFKYRIYKIGNQVAK